MTDSDIRLHTVRSSAFLVAAALLIAVGIAMVIGIRGFIRSTDWVGHTYQVMAAAEAVRSSTRAAESSARGYRLTSRAALQAGYFADLPEVRADATRLVELTADNPTQQQRSKQLRTLVEQRIAELQRLIDLQNTQGAAQAQAAGINSVGFMQMERINAHTDRLLAEERRLLGQRREESARLANILIGIIVAGILLPLLMLGALTKGLARDTRRSKQLERDAHVALGELAVALEARGRLSEQRRVLGAYAGMLQSCQDLPEAMNLTAQVIGQLLPHAGGRCYVLRASQNLAETVSHFGVETVPSDPVLAPASCWALRRGQPHRSTSGVGNIYCEHLHIDGLPADGWTLCVPLMAQGTSLGLLHLNGTGGDAAEDATMIESIAEQLSLAMINLQLRESLRAQSLRDPLTGLYNRRYLEENLQREIARCERRGLPLSVLMLDVDHFKQLNDQHGHAAGDAMLASIAQALQSMTRTEDIACRYGGEEFMVVLPETDAAAAQRRAEAIREAIAATTVLHLRKQVGPKTASLGVATFPVDARTPQELIERADAALYRAKAQGRDRVVVHGQVPS